MPNAKETPPGFNPRGKKHETPGQGLSRFKLGSPFGYVILLVLGFLLFRNVFQDAGVRREHREGDGDLRPRNDRGFRQIPESSGC